MNTYKCESHKLNYACLGCVRVWIAKHDAMLKFIRECLNHTCCLCNDACCISCNAKEILEEIGEYK